MAGGGYMRVRVGEWARSWLEVAMCVLVGNMRGQGGQWLYACDCGGICEVMAGGGYMRVRKGNRRVMSGGCYMSVRVGE